MASYPGALASFAGFTSSHTLAVDNHAAQHNLEQGEILAVQTKIGTGASTPASSLVLRGTSAGTSAWGQVALTTDVTGTLPTANGGTGQNNLSSLPLISPVITGGGSWAGSPVLSTPTIADFTNATHDHSTTAKGGQLTSSAFANGAISAANLSTSAITLGYAEITAGVTSTSATGSQLPGLTVTVTIPTGGRRVEITVYSYGVFNSVAATNFGVNLWDGAVGGTQLQAAQANNVSGGATQQNLTLPMTMVWSGTPPAGTKTYNVGGFTSSGTVNILAATTSPAFILVKVI